MPGAHPCRRTVILQWMSLAGFLLAAAIMMDPSFARAGNAELVQCLDAPTGGEQKRCTQALFRQADDELKKTYADILEKAAKADARASLPNATDKGASAAVAESQRAWGIYRDAECWGVVGRGGGSGRMVWVFGCLAEKTTDRIRELNVPFYQR